MARVAANDDGSLEDGVDAAEVRDDELLEASVTSEDVSGARAIESVPPVASAGTAAQPPASIDSETQVSPPAGTLLPARGEARFVREAEVPRFRPTRVKKVAVLAGAAAALVLASIAGSQFSRRSEPATEPVAARLPESRVVERAPEARTAPPAPSPATTAASGTAPATPERAGAEPGQKAVASVAVIIKTVPERATVYRGRERLGVGSVEVTVEPDAKQRFVARLDGYVPARFTLDGSRESVTISLQRAPKVRAAPAAPKTDSPYDDEPDETANTAAAPVPAAVPSPEPAAARTPEEATAAAPGAEAPAPEPTPASP